ncbi:hypothetical protein FDP41_011050 [Naegleria fowleri]|uniref:DUF1697 domain-containing protein n=1 Tax=Naegleria fowleri TaxID=5763 RepID=A0A6A5C831_NAEFO|nr:uncharacterized protein FDP41_011050 [Naegleria fowleri]KAF0983072.1 hypothetical protein FDP41_011050 [Naegleria fowleri]CAG4712381.1 unnamed protein product [Naegleria fowleri]
MSSNTRTQLSYISLLRGVNVGGHRSIKMSELQSIFSSVGCINIKTLKTSGNVVFEYLHSDHGVDDVKNLEQAYSKGQSHKDLYVTLLAETPSDESMKEVCDDRKLFEPDEFHIEGRTIYMKLVNTATKTKLTNK